MPTQNEPPTSLAPLPAPAPGVVGTTLLEESKKLRKRHPRNFGGASTGISALDTDVLGDEGLPYGRINVVSGVAGTGKSLVALEALTSHLLAHPWSSGAVVDTTGTFSAARLRDVIVARTLGQEAVIQLLNRVKVMRVFDFQGLVEAVEEVQGLLQGRETVEGAEEIADSEDEGEEAGEEEADGKGDVGMLVVDNITNVTSAMMGRDHVQGQASLQSFARSLSLLAYQHSICTLLLNGCVSTTRLPLDMSKGTPPQQYQHRTRANEDASIFGSTVGKPALGKAFQAWPDLHLLLSRVPRTQEDAMTAYAGDGRGRRWEEVGVCEVLTDRFGDRTGRWGCIATTRGRLSNAF